MKVVFTLFLYISMLVTADVTCPIDKHQSAPKKRQTIETQIINIVKIETSCGRCTGWIVGKNRYMTAAHCFIWPTSKIEAVFMDGTVVQLKLLKLGKFEQKPDEDMALLAGSTEGRPVMDLAKGCPLPQMCGSFGYGQDGNQKAVRCYGGKPVPGSDGLWVFAGEIDHGDSGGPVCDINGDVIGMQVAMDPDGRPLFFAVPNCKISEFMK